MKNRVLIISLAVLLSLIGSTGFAALSSTFDAPPTTDGDDVITDNNGPGIQVGDISFSAGVEAAYNSADGTEYVAATQNVQAGEDIRVYASTSDDAALWYNTTEDSWPGDTVSDVDWSGDSWNELGK